MANAELEKASVTPHPEGRILHAYITPRVRPVDIANQGGFSRAYTAQVLSGKVPASPRFIKACRDLGLPVDAIFGEKAAA